MTNNSSNENLEAKICPFWENKPAGLEGCISGKSLESEDTAHLTEFCMNENYPACKHYRKYKAKQHKPESATAGSNPANNGAYILFVDDEPTIRRWSERALGRIYPLVLAEDGEEALRLMETRGKPAVLVTDMVMPKMAGGELIRRAREKYGGIPIIIMTGYSEENLYAYEPDAVLKKPFNKQTLTDAIDRALKTHAP